MSDHSVAGTSTASTSSRISAEDAEEYTRALGQVMSGGWRLVAAAQRLGVPAALGMTTEEWVREIGGYVRLGLDERREAVKELTNPDADFPLSNRQAAEVLGVDEKTVRNDLRGAEVSAAEPSSLEGGAGAAADTSAPEEAASPSTEEAAAEPGSPTVGDVGDAIREHFDEEGLAEEQARGQHIQAMRRVRVTWLRFMAERPPGVLAEGLDRADLGVLVRDLEMYIDWLGRARECAMGAGRPRRVG